MPATDLALLTDAARLAGQTALAYWRRDPETWTKPDDTPVSAADLAVDRLMRDALTHARPGYGWLSEEGEDDPTRLDRAHCLILDPIDGTRAFLDGQRTWAISLAVTTGPDVTAAVVHLPARDLTYTATRAGAFLNGARLSCGTHARPQNARVMANRAVLRPEHWRAPPQVRQIFRPSMAYRLACVADDKCDAMLTFRQAWEWDIAAGALIAAASGATVTDRTGGPLRFNSPRAATDGVLAANPALHAGLRAALADAA
ncbi:3'(2'),5'-bisphosphate nucleotidase CysQ [Palleronia rufa]|uniref:3'(2'),5'-bisphosphate nucleotidase CysQ n=1 Tax=Palleronia rufa TaxID=1530186 RepID=UPI00056A31DD|nr:3'(2'),5'-bisphosphate nucleotidase CysQ [Palleronia rufa]